MTKFYSAGGSQSVSLVDGIQVVKRVVNRIKSIIQMPLSRKQRQVKRKKCGEIRGNSTADRWKNAEKADL